MESSASVWSRSTSATPAPPVPSPRNVGRTASPTGDTNSSQLVDRWADVLFAFHAEYPDELTIDVCDKYLVYWVLGEAAAIIDLVGLSAFTVINVRVLRGDYKGDLLVLNNISIMEVVAVLSIGWQ